MPIKEKRGKIKKKAKSKSLDDLSTNYSDSTDSSVLVKRMASTTLSSGSKNKKRSQNDDEIWGITSSKTSHSTHSSPWLSRKRFYIEALLDPEDKSFGRFMSGEISDSVFDHLTLEEVKDLKLVFDAFDTDCSGSIDISELQRVMNALGFKTSTESVKKMIGSLDLDDSGKIEFNEFLEFLISKQGNDRDIHSELMKGFKLIDNDSTGKISLENLRSACRENGIQLSDQELRDMIEEADKDGDSEVSPSEFIEIMLKTNLF